MPPGESRKMLWRGFWIMCAAVVVWIVTFRLAVGSAMKVPHIRAGATAAEIQKQIDEMPKPTSMMSWMIIGQAVSGILIIGGLIVTGIGLVEYNAELRATWRG